MKLSILQTKLKEALNIIEKIASKSPSLPVLGNVLLEAENNYLKLSATNLETGVKFQLLSKVEKPGKITVPANLFANFVNYLPSSTLNLEVKQGILHLDCENVKTKINGLDPKEFPIIPKVEKTEKVNLKSGSLCKGLSQVINIASLSTIKPEISGIYWNFEKNNLTMAATDSFRLGEKKISLDQSVKETSFILPHRSAVLLASFFSEKNLDLDVYFSSDLVMFESGKKGESNIEFVSKLIEGEYPKYQEIIPKDQKAEVVVDRKEFLVQLKTASIFASRINEVKLKVLPKEQKIQVLCQNSELGEHISTFSAEIKGEESEVSFNYKFLIDGLAGIRSKKISFSLSKDQTGEEGPAVLRPFQDKNYLYVVMPIQPA